MRSLFRAAATVLTLTLLLTGAACGGKTPAAVTESPAPVPAEPAPQPRPDPSPLPPAPVQPSPEVLALRENFPTIDGSTSLKPLDAAVRAGVFGIPYEEAYAQVTHTTTYGSFYNLLDGKVDMIYSVPFSEDQRTQAEEEGLELCFEPVSREGFVFVVNGENPVSALTQEQIRGIYSGTITNWKEVGGDDAPITAFQRNADSGSQNYMIAFMGDTPLTDAPIELRPASMVGLMDVIAAYDNAKYSIGYSVYTYAADMYYGASSVKFIAVDGVAPSKQTMASGEYPLTGLNYAVFPASAAEDAPVRRLARWIQSDEGQLSIASAGSVTLRDMGYDYGEKTLDRWQAVGTGGEALTDSYRYSSNIPVLWEGELRPWEEGISTGLTARIDCLTDKDLEREVNAFLQDALARSDGMADDMKKTMDGLNRVNGYDPEDEDSFPLYGLSRISAEDGSGEFIPSAQVEVKAVNGYLSAAVVMEYEEWVMEGFAICYDAQCATWDMVTGRRLSPEELFADGVDCAAALNDFVSRKSVLPYDSYGRVYGLTGDFAALPKEGGWAITPDTLYVFCEPFVRGAILDLDELEDGLLVTRRAEGRDMTEAFEPPAQTWREFRTVPNMTYERMSDGLFSAAFLPETTPAHAAANEDMRTFFAQTLSRETVAAQLEEQGWQGDPDDLECYDCDWYLTNYGDRWAMFGSYGSFYVHDVTEERYQDYELPGTGGWRLYDLTTGAHVTPEALVKEGWQDHAMLGAYSDWQGELNELDLFSAQLNTIAAVQADEEDPLSPWYVNLCIQIEAPAWEDFDWYYINLLVEPDWIKW